MPRARARGRTNPSGTNGRSNGKAPPAEWPEGARLLTPGELRWTCPPRELRAAIAAEALAAKAEQAALEAQLPDAAARQRRRVRQRLAQRPPVDLDEVVGQERAIQAITTGLSTEAPGFHLFVVGQPGSGRESLVRAALGRFRPPLPASRDRLYAANFRHPDRPRLLSLPRGRGRRFKREVDDTLALLRRAIPRALDDELHLARCDRLRRRHDARAARLIEDLAAELRPLGLIVGPIPEAFGTPELRVEDDRGEPIPQATLVRRLAAGEARRTKEVRARLALFPTALERVAAVAGEARAIARQGTLAVRRIEARVAKDVARGFADDLAQAYPGRAVKRWLDTFLSEVGEKLDLFFEPRKDDPSADFKGPPLPGAGEERRPGEGDPLAPFRVNLFVDARERPSPPIVFEPNPTYANLLGGLDGDPALPDHLRLRAGSLLHANGGVLVVDAAELQQDPAAWRALKRAVRSGWIEVQRAANQGSALRPEAVRTEFKLVAIGTDEQWDQLAQDPDFPDVFKVKVQLEDQLPRSADTTQRLARAILRACRRSGLRAPDAGALGRLLERAARLSGRADRFASCFDELLDVLQEADRLAAAARRGTIRAREVEEALARRRGRHDQPERQIQQELDLGVLDIDLEGARAAVVNALVVYDTGDHAFARPCRVTATTGVGKRGLVDIEREARLSGDFHHKGVQILSGLLTDRYAQTRPLRLSATVCFEQSYALVDGDSASVAEALALFSALGDAPVRQGWAVTGALDQKGRVQPIGDVNLKVEGFHDACAARGLTGAQGVLIPASNVGDLMLREDVVAAVAAGRFRVVAVRTLDQVLALMTGLPTAARVSAQDAFPPGTLDARVDARLEAYAEAARRYDRGS